MWPTITSSVAYLIGLYPIKFSKDVKRQTQTLLAVQLHGTDSQKQYCQTHYLTNKLKNIANKALITHWVTVFQVKVLSDTPQCNTVLMDCLCPTGGVWFVTLITFLTLNNLDTSLSQDRNFHERWSNGSPEVHQLFYQDICLVSLPLPTMLVVATFILTIIVRLQYTSKAENIVSEINSKQ